MIFHSFCELGSISFDMRVEALPISKMTEVQVVIAGTTLTECDEVLHVQLKVGVKMERLFVMNLQAVATAASCTSAVIFQPLFAYSRPAA
jgi:hypothetical protein